MSTPRSVIVTVAYGESTERLDYTFTSFATHNPEIPLHAIILGDTLPKRQSKGITYHLRKSEKALWVHELREVYFRRMDLLDILDADFALVVDSYDVLCLQPLPPFERILGGADVAACVERTGARYVAGQGFTANFLNGGVFFWNIKGSQDIRREIVDRGRKHYRTTADDQYCINEVIQTKHYQRLRILPCQYNYRAYLNRKQAGWPTVSHLDGVLIYHNGPCIDNAKALGPVLPQAQLPPVAEEPRPLSDQQQFEHRVLQWGKPDVVHESSWFLIFVEAPLAFFGRLIDKKCFQRLKGITLQFLMKLWPVWNKAIHILRSLRR